MKKKTRELDERLEALLAEEQYVGHPLRDALIELRAHMEDQLERIERIASLSDAFQSMARQRELSLTDRFDRQLRRLSRVVSISDRYQGLMRDINQAVTDASNHDPLTELLNRRALMAALKEKCKGVEGEAPVFVLAMLDVDHFKSINDRYGHEAGDRALTALARVMESELMDDAVFGRWGGEEFLAVFDGGDADGPRAVCERLMAVVRDLALPISDHTSLKLTLSVGITTRVPGETLSATINRADAALYASKQSGRDRLTLGDAPAVASVPSTVVPLKARA